MSKPIIVAVAPVAHALGENASFSLDAQGVAEEVLACAEAGASVAHLHVRDASGVQTRDLSVYDETLRRIRAGSDILLQGSTGGVTNLSLADRCVSVTHPLTQLASLNLGSINLGEGAYINTLPDIRYWAAAMRAHEVAPEYEIFDLSMIDTGRRLLAEGLVDHATFCFSLGFENALAAEPRYLEMLHAELMRDGGPVWALIHENMTDMRLLLHAAALGADMIRVGFEDSRHLGGGRLARRNVELVRALVEQIKAQGYEIATPAYAAQRLGVRKGWRA